MEQIVIRKNTEDCGYCNLPFTTGMICYWDKKAEQYFCSYSCKEKYDDIMRVDEANDMEEAMENE